MNNVFDGHEEFFELDSRLNRKFLPTDKENIIQKYKYLIPEKIVKGKTVLDLGSHLGSVGHWVLSYGAKSYTGVEIQDNFVKNSKRLLSSWSNVNIIKMDLQEFLKTNNTKFDVVLAFGILYGFTNHTEILKNIFSIADTVIIISATPAIIFSKSCPEISMIEYNDSGFTNTIVSDKDKKNFQGFSGVPSKSYVDKVARINGFSSFKLKATGEKITTKIILKNSSIPSRYFARYDRTHDSKELLLEEMVVQNTEHVDNQFTTDSKVIKKLNDEANKK